MLSSIKIYSLGMHCILIEFFKNITYHSLFPSYITLCCVCTHAQLCPTLWDPMDCSVPVRLLCPWNFSSKNTGEGCHFLLQGIFPTQGSNPWLLLRLLYCRQILYCWATGALCYTPKFLLLNIFVDKLVQVLH